MFACPCGEEREGEEGREGHCHRAKGKGEAEALAEVFHSFPAKECNLSKAIETDGTQRRADRDRRNRIKLWRECHSSYLASGIEWQIRAEKAAYQCEVTKKV